MKTSADDLLERLGETQAQARDRGRTQRHARVLERLHASIEEDTPAAGRRGWIAGGAVLLSAAAVLALWMSWPRPRTYEVEAHNQAIASSSVVVAEDQLLTMRFSDGSTITLQPGTRVRVGQQRIDGVDLVLERGILEANLEPKDGGSWTLMAGSHTLQLRAGISRIEWTPEADRLIVADGPRKTLALAEPPPIEVQVEVDAAGPLAEEPAPAPAPAVVAPVPREPTQRIRKTQNDEAPARPAEPRDDWRALARRGAHRQALAEAEAAGFSRLCANLNAEVLLQLADTARYARKTARAREALGSVRRRFPGSEAAATAAFDLGRLAKRDTSECAKWFRTYLDERPKGSMAQAARQRLEDCVNSESEAAAE